MEATRKLISKSGEVFASPVTYLASYVIPTEKRTAGELHTLNEILKLSGAGGSGEKTKGDAASNESNASSSIDDEDEEEEELPFEFLLVAACARSNIANLASSCSMNSVFVLSIFF